MELKTSKLWNRNLLLSVLFAVLFVVFPFWSGLFFEVPTAYSVIFAAVVVLLVGIWGIVRKAEVKCFAVTDWLVLAYTLVTLLTLFTFSNLEFTLTGITKQFGYLFVYLIVRLLSRSVADAKPLLYLVALSGAVFSVFGILAVTHVIEHAGALFTGTGEMRIASVFEYPNSYASYLAVALLFGLVVQTEVRKPIARFLWLTVNALTFTGLVLTYSRGGWVVFAGVFVVMLLLARNGQRMPLTVNSLAALVAMAAGLPLVGKGTVAGAFRSAGIGLAIVVAVALVLSFLLGRVTERLSTLSVKKGVLIPALVVVLAGGSFAVVKLGLLPKDVVNRIASINFQLFSVQQRLVFYKDGLSALQDHPIIGAGDRTWEATFYKYQSYPYYTTSPHSVLIDQIMNVGIVGTLLFLLVFGFAVWSFWRLRKVVLDENRLILAALFAAFLEVVVHALVDVDFNYGVISYLFWILVALAALRQPVALEVPNSINSWKWNPKNRWVWWVVSTATLVVALFNGTFVYAQYHLEQAKSQLGNASMAYAHLDKAVAWAPYVQDVKGLLNELDIRYYERTKDPVILQLIQNRLLSLPKLAPNSADLLGKTGQDLYKYEKVLQANELLKQAWADAPYRSELADQYMIISTQIGEALQKDQKDRAKGYFQETLNTYQLVQQRIAGFQYLSHVLKPERPYAITPQMNEQAAESALFLQRFADAERFATEALKTPQSNIGKMKAVLLLAQQKQNKPIDPQRYSTELADQTVAAAYKKLNSLL